MPLIEILGTNIEIIQEDYDLFVKDLTTVSGSNVQGFKIKAATLGRSAKNKDCYLCEIDDTKEIIAIKRCYKDPKFVKREKTVADLRQKFNMPHYEVSKKKGLKLRKNPSDKNPVPLDDWETSDFVLINFGKEGIRKDFEHLNVAEISNSEDFFKQYGEWTAFNYIIGAKDRFGRNYVYDTALGMLYSVDNEEAPYVNKKFIKPDYQIQMYAREISKFLPKGPTRDGLVMMFRQGFMDKWHEIKAMEKSISGTDLDYSYVKQRLEHDKPETVLALINL